MAAMEVELADLIGRQVELRTYGDLSRFFATRCGNRPGSSMPSEDEVDIDLDVLWSTIHSDLHALLDALRR